MTEEQIIIQYKALVLSQIKRFKCKNREDREDLKQCGFIGLIKAYRHFDPNRNVKFITYATTCIYHEMLQELVKKKKLISNQNITKYKISTKQINWDFLHDLSPIQQNITIMKYSGYTLKEICQYYSKNKDWLARQMKQIRELVKYD